MQSAFNLEILKTKSKFLKKLGDFGSLVCLPLFVFIAPIFISLIFVELCNKNRISHISLKYGFGKKDLIDYGLNEYIFKENEYNKLKGEVLEKKYQNIFKDILYYIGPIQCLIKAKEIFEQIINLLDNLSNKHEEEWNKFHIKKILNLFNLY